MGLSGASSDPPEAKTMSDAKIPLDGGNVSATIVSLVGRPRMGLPRPGNHAAMKSFVGLPLLYFRFLILCEFS
jgi:hypothetical protein